MSAKKVLVIDDEDFIRELVKDFLEMEGILCDGTENPDEAYEWIKTREYNLILLDRNLGKNRAEVIIKEIHLINPKIPVIILTGDAECSDEFIQEIGATGLIFKPFQVTEFMDNISQYLEI